MFAFIKRFFNKKPINTNPSKEKKDYILSTKLEDNLNYFMPYVNRNVDVIYRPITLNTVNGTQAAVIYISGIADQDFLQRDILRPLMNHINGEDFKSNGINYLIDFLYKSSITVGKISQTNDKNKILNSIFDGLVVIMIDGHNQAIMVDITHPEHRSIDEPPTERTQKGSREGFVEDLTVNISLIRKRLPDPNLIIEESKVGRRTRTDVAIVFIEDIADPNIVQAVRDKINNIDIDGITSLGEIEQLMEDNPYSVFPQFMTTERPDRVVAQLLEGRIVIITSNSPEAMILPSIFIGFLQASEDYSDRPYVATVNRMFRYLAFVLSISLSPLYIALLSFQPELIPFDLLVTLIQAREKVPFPVVVEVLIQEAIIQLVVEAGLRLPVTIGQTVGVVAGIILGQAAISANLASPAIIIIVAMTTIATYSLPNYSMVLATR
ncbi:MAG: spore germination protein, partial [Syntrophomonadaceae bacterium]|nr:spore germination protein [Syntrophomonadaceae bacterium]